MRFSPILCLLLLIHCSSEPKHLEIEVTGEEYQWDIRYPGKDGLLHTEDDVAARQHIHVPSNTDLTIHITSKDRLYTFRVPELKQTQMAVPDLMFKLKFPTGPPAEYTLKGDQMCGFSHESLIGEFTVTSPSEFEKWLERQ